MTESDAPGVTGIHPGTEADLLGALFAPVGRSDPHVILGSCALPGCQYLFVRDVLRDPRFAAASIPPSPDKAFQLLARWMMRLDGDRHRRVRDAFGGLFTVRRVERYRAIIAERAAALIDQAAPAGSMELVAEFARPLPYTVIAEVLGVPPGDRDWLAGAIATLNLGFARQRDTDRSGARQRPGLVLAGPVGAAVMITDHGAVPARGGWRRVGTRAAVRLFSSGTGVVETGVHGDLLAVRCGYTSLTRKRCNM